MIGIGKGYNILKIPPFCQLSKEYQNGIIKTDMCLLVFSFEHCTIEIHFSKGKKGGNFKIIYPVLYAIIFISNASKNYFLYWKFWQPKIVIFYTDIVTGKVVLWCFLGVKWVKKSTIQLF